MHTPTVRRCVSLSFRRIYLLYLSIHISLKLYIYPSFPPSHSLSPFICTLNYLVSLWLFVSFWLTQEAFLSLFSSLSLSSSCLLFIFFFYFARLSRTAGVQRGVSLSLQEGYFSSLFNYTFAPIISTLYVIRSVCILPCFKKRLASGEQGYFRLRRGYNMCAVDTGVTVPVLAQQR